MARESSVCESLQVPRPLESLHSGLWDHRTRHFLSFVLILTATQQALKPRESISSERQKREAGGVGRVPTIPQAPSSSWRLGPLPECPGALPAAPDSVGVRVHGPGHQAPATEPCLHCTEGAWSPKEGAGESDGRGQGCRQLPVAAAWNRKRPPPKVDQFLVSFPGGLALLKT